MYLFILMVLHDHCSEINWMNETIIGNYLQNVHSAENNFLGKKYMFCLIRVYWCLSDWTIVKEK